MYNWAYWWESHEVFEGFWHTYGRSTSAGNFFQALIQCAAANLKRELGNEASTRKLAAHGLARLRETPSFYMGLDTATFAEEIASWLNERGPAVRIRLACPGAPEAPRLP
ncbi:MAG: DUF309 domain-containing protein [Nitrospira sp.]|nr:DUF309 domain-containing protein [Nitrospira sp.]